MTKKTIILAGFIITKLLLQYFLINPEYELHRDEFLHLDQAHHLAWGYFSVPPFTSWISIVVFMLGGSVFWIKFFPALFGALTMVVVWKAIEELKGNLFALVLGATGVLFSSLLRLNMLYQPNSMDILAWTALYFLVIKYISTENTKWLYIAAVAFAIGFLNKYNIIFLLAGLVPALLLTSRTIFTEKKLYCAALLALLIISPNLLWQYYNNFPVIHHMKELAETQLVNVNRWDFLKDQLLFFIGALFVIVAALYALLFYPPLKKYEFFFFSLCFTLLVFTYLKAKSYYAVGLYPIYISFGAVYLGHVFKTGWKKYLQPVAILIPLLLFIPIYKIAFPNRSPGYIVNNPDPYKKFGLLRWEDGKDHALPQDFADMLGWKELAFKVDSVYETFANRDQTLILCDNYGEAGAINYYAKNKHIKAVSFNADYINWFDLSKQYINLIRVKSFESEGDEMEKTSPYFDSSFTAGSITNSFAREFGTTIFAFNNARIDVNKRVHQEIEKEKNYR